MKHSLVLVTTLLSFIGATAAQETRGFAIVNARVLSMAGPPIERGTVLVRDGKVEQVGAQLTVPAGYRTIDAQGGTLMPGVVNAHAHTGLTAAAAETTERPNRFRRGGRRRGGGGGGPTGNAEDKTQDRVIDRLYARQDVFKDVLRDGITTIGLAPLGRGLTGQGAVVRPHGDDAAAMTVQASAFVAVAPVADTKTKDLIRKAIENGQRASERRKRRAAAKEEAPPQEATKPSTEEKKEGADEPAKEAPAPKPAEAPSGEAATAGAGRSGRAPAEDDPAAEAMADWIDGKTRAFVQLDSAMDFVHWEDVLKDTDAKVVYVSRRHATSSSEGSLEVAIDKWKQRKSTVLLSPDFDTVPNTQYLVNLAARLHTAGVEVGFVLPDHGRALSATRPQLMELVRAGLPADVALRGITLVPAKALGVDKMVGSLEAGKAANLTLWSADPLDPVAQLRGVWLEGRRIEEDAR